MIDGYGKSSMISQQYYTNRVKHLCNTIYPPRLRVEYTCIMLVYIRVVHIIAVPNANISKYSYKGSSASLLTS